VATPAASALNPVRFGFAIPPFLLGVVAAQRVDVAGLLYLGEVLGILFFLMPVARQHLSLTERRLVLFAILWSAAQALSDVYNQTAVSDSLKGVFAPLVFIATILGLAAYLRDNPLRMPSFLLGVALGAIASLALPSQYSSMSALWKFGVGAAVLSVFAVHYSFFLRRKSLVWLFVALVAFLLVSLYFDSRLLAVLPLLAGLAYAFSRAERGVRVFRFFGGRWGVARLLVLIVSAVFLLNVCTTALFSSELFLSRLSPTVAQKYRAQAAGELGVLFGGRSDGLVSIQAFVDQPILGHGSWAKDTRGYRLAYAQKRFELGYAPESGQDVMASPLIPFHSFLMGALVWSGVFGGIFWIVLVYVVLKRFLGTLGRLPVYFYIGTIGLLWDVLFSPFGASARWSTAVFLAAFMAYTHADKAKRRST
jgi:hypothetical protein